MATDQSGPPEELMGIIADRRVQAALAVLKATLGYELQHDDRVLFLRFHAFITEPQPEFITAWRAEPRSERWYHALVNGILGNVQSALACVLYHRDRIVDLESAATKQILETGYQSALPPGSTIGGGNTLMWDFEYQAFVLAYRRCLDFLARGIAAYFRNDFHSFRGLGEFLARAKPARVAEPLIKAHAGYVDRLRFVLSEGGNKSVRDRLSHYEYVTAGTINLTKQGIVIAGGGERLGYDHPDKAVSLTPVVEQHVATLRSCVREMLELFVEGMKAAEQAHKQGA